MSTLEALETILNTRFDGRLEAGPHAAGEACCALELQSVALGLPWTDDPKTLRIWDLRALNDIPVDEAVRAACLLPVLAAYTGSRDWPKARQARVSERLVVLTVQRLIAELPGLPAAVRAQCRAAARAAEAAPAAAEAARAAGAATEAAAWEATEAAAWVAAEAAQEAARAAWAAAEAARAAGAATGAVARVRIMRQACQLWLEAASIES